MGFVGEGRDLFGWRGQGGGGCAAVGLCGAAEFAFDGHDGYVVGVCHDRGGESLRGGGSLYR